jgi:16S rRNA (cytosine1402-N4)-methyltransferase
MIATYAHIPVLRERSLELLLPALQGPSPLLLDATLGLGGHTEAFLASTPNLRVLGIDRDLEALDHARARLEPYGDRVSFAHARYDELGEVLDTVMDSSSPDAMLFDLGVSSLHLDKPERGFSYSVDAPLDMRMNVNDDVTAADVLATYDKRQLAGIFRRFGDEKLADRYAGAIVEARAIAPLLRTGELVDLLQRATPYALRDKGHPAKRVFQALRIEVNQELESWAHALPVALDRLAPGGRIAVMSYHSGEDRLTKHELRRRSHSSAPLGLPRELPEHRAEFNEITRGAETASAEEIALNPRAASVRLRAAEKLRKVTP